MIDKQKQFIAIAQLQFGLSQKLNTSTAEGEPFFIEKRKEVTHLVIPISRVSTDMLGSLGLDETVLNGGRKAIGGCRHCGTGRHEGGRHDQDHR